MTGVCYIPSRAISDAALPRSALRLLLALHVAYDLQEVFSITLPDLKELSGLSIPTIRAALAALLKADYLHPVGRLLCEHRRCCFGQEPTLKLDRDLCARLLALGLPNTAMLVFLYLYQCLANGCPEQDIRMIAYRVDSSVGRISENLKALTAAGLLRVERRQSEGGRNLRNRYSIPSTAAANYIPPKMKVTLYMSIANLLYSMGDNENAWMHLCFTKDIREKEGWAIPSAMQTLQVKLAHGNFTCSVQLDQLKQYWLQNIYHIFEKRSGKINRINGGGKTGFISSAGKSYFFRTQSFIARVNPREGDNVSFCLVDSFDEKKQCESLACDYISIDKKNEN